MSLKRNKQKVFSAIAALKLLAGDTTKINTYGLEKINLKNGMPKLKISASLPSVNNGTDPITFLLDLLKSLVGQEFLLESLTNTLTYSAPQIIDVILNLLKKQLKEITSCGVNPTIPAFLTNPGIIVQLEKIDAYGMFKIEPNTLAGKILYQDITTPYTNSSDFNTFLYGVIQNDGTSSNWKNLLDVTFNSVGTSTRPNNSFTIKLSSGASVSKLTDLNNSLINNLTSQTAPLIDSKQMVNDMVNSIYGTVSSTVNKTLQQLEREEQINNIVDCIINSDAGDEISDDYFTFSNEEVYIHQEKALLKQKGIVKLECCNKVAASIPFETLTNFSDEMDAATNVELQKTVLTKNLKKMALQSSANATNPIDIEPIKLNFFESLIKNMTKAIVGKVISPKVMIIFLLNYKIIYGNSSDYDNVVDFLKKNKSLIDAVVKKISELIIKILITIALKKIAELVASSQLERMIEKAKNRIEQLKSLSGAKSYSIKNISLNASLEQ